MKKARLMKIDQSHGAPSRYDQALRSGALMGRSGMVAVQSGIVDVPKEARKFILAFADGLGNMLYLVWVDRNKACPWTEYANHGNELPKEVRMVVP